MDFLIRAQEIKTEEDYVQALKKIGHTPQSAHKKFLSEGWIPLERGYYRATPHSNHSSI